ncbi:hypothetical protein AB0B01_29775 [Streptomyces sp. NPDC044571]|uniref:hypothetical protein n=1 Tax=Streptomyces sp. NPDC044571 TaxID=3155371 RepID=UPI0033C609A5
MSSTTAGGATAIPTRRAAFRVRHGSAQHHTNSPSTPTSPDTKAGGSVSRVAASAAMKARRSRSSVRSVMGH